MSDVQQDAVQPAARSVREPRKAAGAQSEAAPVRKTVMGRWGILVAILAFGVGMVIGVFGMRQHYRSVEVVASVNGDKISKDQLFDRLQRAAGQTAMQQMAMENLHLQYASKLGVLPTDEQVEARFQELKKQPNFDQTLRAQNQTPEQFKQGLRVSMAQAAVVAKGVDVSDKEIKAFYDTNVDKKNENARFYRPDLVQIAVIVTETQAEARQAQTDLANGIAWTTVVEKYSKDQSKANNGILPPTLRGRTRAAQVPGLEEEIFKMKVGDSLGPKNFAGAWWIIRCLEKQPEYTLKFDDVKGQCEIGAKLVKAGPDAVKKAETGFAEFQKEADIKAFWPQYTEALKIKEN